MPTPGLAKFDSATAMVQALSRFLHGRDFAGLGQGAAPRTLVRLADVVPRHARERLFATLGAREGVAPERIDTVDTRAVAEWATALYPQRRYPAVMVGSSNGAVLHLAAAHGIPWLPQTFLALLRQQGHPDDPVAAMRSAAPAAERFLATNPEVQLHHMHDPAQDRLMLGLVSYFRFKYRSLPDAYRRFIEGSLAPGGTIILVDCRRRWPVTRVSDRHVYQFGAVGGPTVDEYFNGGERVRSYLARQGSSLDAWRPPAPTEEAPEAEWGFEPSLATDLQRLADAQGYRVARLGFDDPEDLSPAVAEFYRRWHEERGIPEHRLVLESFILIEPYWVLRTGSVPFWMTFNLEPSLRAAARYLESHGYDRAYLMLFAHGVDSVGVPPIEDWQRLLDRARTGGGLLGVNPRTYPAHFAAFGRYSAKLRALPRHYPMPPPLPLARLHEFIDGWRHF